jgi:spermidine synthase
VRNGPFHGSISSGRLTGLSSRTPILAGAFLSGLAALSLQLTWTRRLSIGLGHELPAVLGVATAFFIGLALGGVLGSWALSRVRSAARLAAGVEGLAAGWAFFTVPLLDALLVRLPGWRGVDTTAGEGWLWAFLLPMLVLLPATAALGATFPATEALLRRSGRERSIGWYAAVNTLGAVGGVALTLAWWHPAWGFRVTTGVAGILQVLAGYLFWSQSPGEPRPEPRVTSRREGASSRVGWGALAGLAGSGFLGLGVEVVGVRILGMILGGTVYSYAIVLGVWLLGTASGVGIWTRYRRQSWWWLPAVAGGLLIAAGIGLAQLPAGLAMVRRLWGDGFAVTTAAECLGVLALLGPLTGVLGAWFAEQMDAAVGDGVAAGNAVSANTLGAALAPLAWGAATFPWLGARGTWLALIAGYGLMGLASGGQGRVGSVAARALAALGLALAAGGLLPSELAPWLGPPGARPIWRREDAGETVAVWEFPDGNRSLTVNNRFSMGGTASTNAAARQAHLPLLRHPAPRTAAFLGLGTGLSFAAAGAHPGLTAVGVELVPGVVAALPQFAPFNLQGPGLRVVTADARCFIRATPDRYDVVVADLFHPDRDGAGWLYTREHFAAIRARLNPGGLACQWLPWFQLDREAREVVIRAWELEFPGSEAWLLRWTTADTPVVGLMGWVDGVSPPGAPRIREGMGVGQEALRRCGLGDAVQFRGCWLGWARDLLSKDGTGNRLVNTDDRPVSGWLAARYADRARREQLDDLLEAVERMGEGLPAGWEGVDGDRWASFRRARNAYLRGLVAGVRGRGGEEEKWLWVSVSASDEFPSAYSHLVSLAVSEMRKNPRIARERLERLRKVRPEKPLAESLLKRLEGL